MQLPGYYIGGNKLKQMNTLNTERVADMSGLTQSCVFMLTVESVLMCGCLFCLFDLILYVHSTIFQLCGTVLPGFNQY